MAGERGFDPGAVGIVLRPYGRLPEAQVVWWRVEVPCLGPEIARVGTGHLRLLQHLLATCIRVDQLTRVNPPAEDHGGTGPDVLQRHGHVDDAVLLLEDGPP